MDKLNKLEALKVYTKKFFSEEFQLRKSVFIGKAESEKDLEKKRKYEAQIREFDTIIENVNEAFWEDIFLEIYYDQFISKSKSLIFDTDRKKCNKAQVEKWTEFTRNNSKCFEKFRSIGISALNLNEEGERYQNIRERIPEEIWTKVYPVILFKMHDFELEELKENYRKCIINSFSKEHRKLNRLALLICREPDYSKKNDLISALKYEIGLVSKEEKSIEELLELAKELEEQWGYVAEREYMESLYKECKELEEKTKNRRVSEVDKLAAKFVEGSIETESLIWGQQRIPSNVKLFLTILNYVEKPYDIALVLKLCNELTGWIDYYLYKEGGSRFPQFKGIAMNYYLAREEVLKKHWQYIFFSEESWEELYDEMLACMKGCDIEDFEYVQTEKLFDELMELTDEGWGNKKPLIIYLENEFVKGDLS